jgi:hypothetical protein
MEDSLEKTLEALQTESAARNLGGIDVLGDWQLNCQTT